MAKRKTTLVTLREGATPLLAAPKWLIDTIDPSMWKGHGDNKFFKVSVRNNSIIYTPLYFAGAHGCPEHGADSQ